MANAFILYSIQIYIDHFISYLMLFTKKLKNGKIIGCMPYHNTSAFLQVIISILSSYFLFAEHFKADFKTRAEENQMSFR